MATLCHRIRGRCPGPGEPQGLLVFVHSHNLNWYCNWHPIGSAIPADFRVRTKAGRSCGPPQPGFGGPALEEKHSFLFKQWNELSRTTWVGLHDITWNLHANLAHPQLAVAWGSAGDWQLESASRRSINSVGLRHIKTIFFLLQAKS